jgi:alkanesulfonate monooxygenase SsuD/methylene tetrahydromethanopterin reductase-like flavin-dependent oxidoreductase (luciferase family)
MLLRQIFNGEKTDFAGETVRSRGFRLAERPSAPIPIYLGAMGPKMLELCGEIADGVVLNDFTPVDFIGTALEWIDNGAKRAGRRAEDLEIIKRRAVYVTDDEGVGLEYFRQTFALYASAPAYQTIIIRLGYRDAIEEVRAGYAARDRARVTAAISDEMVARVFAFGNADQCRARFAEDAAAGIDTAVVSPPAVGAVEFARAAEVFAPGRT